jgi:DNA-binding beta-propeller fold protein YncE
MGWRRGSAALVAVVATIVIAGAAAGEGAETPTLQLEAKIPLINVGGRIDHMAVDLARQRLFVAALGHDSLAVVDLKAQRLDRLISGLREPQGVGYEPTTDMVYVANGGDGSVRLFSREPIFWRPEASSLAAMPTMFAWIRRPVISLSAMATVHWRSLMPLPTRRSERSR